MAHPKSQELLQAQVAAFASDTIANPTNRDYVLDNLADIALGPVVDATRVTSSNEYERTSTGYNVTPAGTEVVAGSATDYLSYLHNRNASHDSVSRRARLLENYRQFGDLADAATEQLGHGTIADVHRIVHNGREYAVRTPRDTRVDVPSLEREVRAALLAQGIPHLKQVVAISYENGKTVAELMPGTELIRLSATELAEQATDEQLDAFIETLTAAHNARLGVDPKPNNIFYDTKEGFGIIDYEERTTYPGRPGVTLAGTIGNGASAIALTGIDGNRLNDPAYGEYARLQREESLKVLLRFQARCAARFGETELGAAVNAAVQGHITEQEKQIKLQG